ncbi:hypothetical protein TSUD_125640 [Trifolium subterraneum]|uniref:Uncharacterized protein n=1 Tax=Trifolium subterraneum TaxID=3900 RepID=A0A2Z6MB57_TRISU|nr:hypothetical protein TSUD_125640 [Trifolium subterraneum]
MESVDFEGYELVNLVPAPCNLFKCLDTCILMSPNKIDDPLEGGVRIFISLPVAAMPKFREEIDGLRFL